MFKRGKVIHKHSFYIFLNSFIRFLLNEEKFWTYGKIKWPLYKDLAKNSTKAQEKAKVKMGG